MNQLASTNPANASLPEKYEHAKRALADCASIDECLTWADKSAALASYARQAKDDQLEKHALRIRARAIRRAGELLKQIESAKGGDRKSNEYQREGNQPLITRHTASKDAGMSIHQAKQAIRVANIPEEKFTEQVESAKPPTITKLAEQGKREAPKPIVDLKGRDPSEFNRSLHFVAMISEYEKEIRQVDLGTILPGLIESEAKKVRELVTRIDVTHDQIATRI